MRRWQIQAARRIFAVRLPSIADTMPRQPTDAVDAGAISLAFRRR
jgi:hypothetical protein